MECALLGAPPGALVILDCECVGVWIVVCVPVFVCTDSRLALQFIHSVGLATSLAIVRPSSIVDCTLVSGGCCHFLQHKRRDQRANVQMTLYARQGGRQLGDWLPQKRIGSKKECIAPLQTLLQGEFAGRMGRGYPVYLPAS